MHTLKRDTSYKYQFPRFTVWFFKLKSYNAIWRCYIIYPKGRLPLIKLPWAEQMATAFLSTLYWRWKYFFFLLLISLCSPSSGVANILYWGVSYYLFVFLSFSLSFSWSCHVSSSVWRSDKRGCDKLNILFIIFSYFQLKDFTDVTLNHNFCEHFWLCWLDFVELALF